ncbi:hypothetical protein [Actinoplanes flavus]|uniref:hypothetical protein n=1 Tax=Actinoplanes flavus TaxID=2820290 RepID=UPI001EE5C36A|nr:hypothetical protein [Actinoplanes flavus]
MKALDVFIRVLDRFSGGPSISPQKPPESASRNRRSGAGGGFEHGHRPLLEYSVRLPGIGTRGYRENQGIDQDFSLWIVAVIFPGGHDAVQLRIVRWDALEEAVKILPPTPPTELFERFLHWTDR